MWRIIRYGIWVLVIHHCRGVQCIFDAYWAKQFNFRPYFTFVEFMVWLLHLCVSRSPCACMCVPAREKKKDCERGREIDGQGRHCTSYFFLEFTFATLLKMSIEGVKVKWIISFIAEGKFWHAGYLKRKAQLKISITRSGAYADLVKKIKIRLLFIIAQKKEKKKTCKQIYFKMFTWSCLIFYNTKRQNHDYNWINYRRDIKHWTRE